jgi:hypothetical protein
MGHISFWLMLMTGMYCKITITKKNTGPLINISKEVGLEVNTKKTKYTLS